MKRNMPLIWAGRIAAFLLVLLALTGIITPGSPLSWGLFALAIVLTLLGGGGRRDS